MTDTTTEKLTLLKIIKRQVIFLFQWYCVIYNTMRDNKSQVDDAFYGHNLYIFLLNLSISGNHM